MKRVLTATLLSSALLVTAGASSAFADTGYGRDGGYRDSGPRYEDVGHRNGHRHWRKPRCSWDKVCWRGKWGQRHCKLVRVCRPGW
jgi:hypothetical protein